jgi:thiol-disulfide isomerase/thioredoxin
MPAALVNAPELDGGVGWLNTDEPIHLKDLRGKIVLLDFWTFCCINCMHVIPDLKKLEAKYPDELVVIGVHSAKFDNERESDNIRNAVLRYGIKHPVVNDAKFAIWHAFAINAWPSLVLIDPDGKIVEQVSGEGNLAELDSAIAGLIAKFDRSGKLNRKPIVFGSDGSSKERRPLEFPGKITADESTGRLFISDSGHNRILVCNQKGDVTAIIGSGKADSTDGSFRNACFNHPQGLAFHDGALYVADTENHLIRRIQFDRKQVTTIAGTGKQAAFRAGGGPALATALSSPWDLVFIGDKLFIAMAGNHQIWLWNPASATIAPFAGSGREDIIDGPLHSAALAQPSGITTDGTRLFFADSEVSAVRAASINSSGQVSTIIGKGLFEFGDQDGVGVDARLQHPLGVFWRNGKLYLADSYNHKVKVVDPISRKVETFLGDGKPGSADGLQARFSEPGGLTAIKDNLYIADTNNHAIRLANLKTKLVRTLPVNLPISLDQNVYTARPDSTSSSRSNSSPALTVSQDGIVKSGAHGKLTLDVSFPSDFHLNNEAPFKYRITRLVGKAVEIDSKELSGTVKPPHLPLTIPFTAGPDGSTGEVQLEADIYYCSSGANQVCKVKSVRAANRIEARAESTNLSVSNRISISADD